MADPTAEARIRDLERRLDLDPGSRLFVALAEEYRKVGRARDALSCLQKGLLAHPGYIAAQVALGRAYLEANLPGDSIATFAKVLQADPANLVAAKSLADIHFSRGDNLEALKKYKLYRGISGDKKVDEVIARLEPARCSAPGHAAAFGHARGAASSSAFPGNRQIASPDRAAAPGDERDAAPVGTVRADLGSLRDRRGLRQIQGGRAVSLRSDARRVPRPGSSGRAADASARRGAGAGRPVGYRV